MRIYISGAITSDPGYLIKFEKAENEVINAGHEAVNPAKVTEQLPVMSHDEYMVICLAMLEVSDCIYLLKDWMQSAGAKTEAREILGDNIQKKIFGISGQSGNLKPFILEDESQEPLLFQEAEGMLRILYGDRAPLKARDIVEICRPFQEGGSDG